MARPYRVAPSSRRVWPGVQRRSSSSAHSPPPPPVATTFFYDAGSLAGRRREHRGARFGRRYFARNPIGSAAFCARPPVVTIILPVVLRSHRSIATVPDSAESTCRSVRSLVAGLGWASRARARCHVRFRRDLARASQMLRFATCSAACTWSVDVTPLHCMRGERATNGVVLVRENERSERLPAAQTTRLT